MAAPQFPGPITATFVKETPPPVQQIGNDTYLNLTLSLEESMLLAFVQNIVKRNLAEGSNLIYLGTSPEMQRGFSEWVAKTFTAKQYTSDELDLHKLVASLWTKTNEHVGNMLRVMNVQAEIENERTWQNAADNYTRQFQAQGKTGKFFTVREAKVLVNYANSIGQ